MNHFCLLYLTSDGFCFLFCLIKYVWHEQVENKTLIKISVKRFVCAMWRLVSSTTILYIEYNVKIIDHEALYIIKEAVLKC